MFSLLRECVGCWELVGTYSTEAAAHSAAIGLGISDYMIEQKVCGGSTIVFVS
jgi:hypothetical protein